MRALPIAVTVLAAALALTACDDSSGGGTDKKGTAAASGTCAAGKFALDVGPGNTAPVAGDTGNIPVTVTNRGSADCTLKGFPGVELSGGGTSWPVAEQQPANPQKVTLQPAEAATFTLTYVRGPKGDPKKSAAAKNVKISLSAGGDAQSFPWTYGEVALKTASAPDASVSPFQTAGD